MFGGDQQSRPISQVALNSCHTCYQVFLEIARAHKLTWHDTVNQAFYSGNAGDNTKVMSAIRWSQDTRAKVLQLLEKFLSGTFAKNK